MKKNLFVAFILFVSMCFVYMVNLEFISSQNDFLVNRSLADSLIPIASPILLGLGIHKKKYNLTSIYLLTVLVKLFVYFFYFDPIFRSDKIVTKEEFFMFFRSTIIHNLNIYTKKIKL